MTIYFRKIFAVALIISLAGILSFFPPQKVSADITTGLLGHWAFEDGSGTSATDSSGNGHTGTLNNGPSWQTGRVGTGALQFDGTDDNVTLAAGSSSLNTNTYTISFWINGTSDFSGTVYRLSNGISNTAYLTKYEVFVTPTNVTFRTGNGSSASDDDVYSTTLTAGSWWHIACTLDGSNAKLCYRNGTLISSATNDVDITVNNGTNAIIASRRNALNNNQYEGLIDDVRVYSRALSLTDIQELYALGADTQAPSIPANLVATPSATTVSLSWDASTDNVGVTGYKIYRNGVQIDTTAGTTYTNTGLSTGNTYSYTVSAYDLVGNESNQSAPAVVTTASRIFQVIQGGGGDYTTIGACVVATEPGDICNVHAGTYTETVSPSTSGTYSLPIIIRANGSDVVNVAGLNFDSVDHVHLQNIKSQSIFQHNITYTFDTYYKTGLFANADYWVLGPVTITSITPDYDGHSNGWQVNPAIGTQQGFDDDCKNGGFNASLIPSLPYTTTATVESIVKTISSGITQSCVKTAAVLTVVSSVPSDYGTTVFRPPYFGTTKPLYSVNNMRTDLLPSLPSVGTPPSLSTVANDFKYLRLEHLTGSNRRDVRPQDAYAGATLDGYGPDFSDENHRDLLRLFLNDPITDKMPALINVTQHALDQAQLAADGWDYSSADGHDPGHRIIMDFGATMLDIPAAKTALLNASNMQEDINYQTGISGNTLWGASGSEAQYWGYITSGGTTGGRSTEDPYGFIDGGNPTDAGGLSAYQSIVSQSWKGSILATILMPSLQAAWPSTKWTSVKNYAERFVNTGAWTQPDPCAPYDGNPANEGVTYGPDPANPGMCILDTDLQYYNSTTDFACQAGHQCGRFPTSHGTNADGGANKSAFVAAMWSAYYGSTDTTSPTVTAFTIPSTSNSLTVSISSFTATDDTAVTGYTLTESSTAPTWNASGWTVSAPSTYTFSSTGSKTLYAWAKDAAGNISPSLNDSVTITLPTYTIGGTISGLSGTVILQNNAGDNLTVTNNGSFTFASALEDTTSYAITVLTQPTGETCTVSNGSGTVTSANVTSVAITCVSSAKAITAFDFNGLSPAVVGTMNEGAKTISLTVPYGTAVTALVPTITHTGSSVSPNTGVAANFSTPQTYTVTAANASTQDYVVTVTVAAQTTHTITASAGANGSISPSGSVTVNDGADQSFTITPNSGYHIETVTADSVSVSATSPYTFTNVTSDHAISATFAANPVVSSGGGGGSPAMWTLPTVPNGGYKMNINSGALTTSNRNVILGFNAGTDIKKVAISMTGDFTDASQEDYTPTKQWDLCSKFGGVSKNPTCPDGKYTVYVKFYTAYGRSSNAATVSSTITLKSGSTAQNLPSTNPFTKYLQYRQTNNDVKRLQIFLNSDPDTKIADTGAGSPGKETNYFGILTYKAVIKFQEKYTKDVLTPWGLKKGTGYVGKSTLNKINELIKQ